MTEKSIMLSIVETEEGMEVHINEKAYGNFGLVGLIEQIKLNLLSESEIRPEKKKKKFLRLYLRNMMRNN